MIENRHITISLGPTGFGDSNRAETMAIKELLRIIKSSLHGLVLVDWDTRNAIACTAGISVVMVVLEVRSLSK